ncbi:MAG: RNA-directed DNA polymerase [Clostridia bacterium]|nr:RNA-directed DNA polymerase [Clostridia bacterium]
MKRYTTPDVTDPELIRAAIDFAAKDKHNRPDVAVVLKDKERYCEALRDMIVNRSFTPSPCIVMEIIDGASKKKRKIYCPEFFPDQCFHHVMMQAAAPVIRKGMIVHSFASVPGRGPHFGKKFVRKWIDTDRKNTKYVAKLDIRKFYPSIPHDRMLEKIHRKFKDPTLLWMFDTFIQTHEDSPGRGLAIGYYPSQWLSNFYLQNLDHYIKETIGVKYYCRYMDDMVLFGANKKVLRQQLRSIMEFLAEEGLSVKGNWQIFRLDYVSRRDKRHHGRDLDFMGFRFFCDRTIIRRRNSLRIRRLARRIVKAGYASIHRAWSLLSSLGWIQHTDSWNFDRRCVSGILSIPRLKRAVSKYSKRIQKQKTQEESMYENCKQRQACRLCC